MSGALKAGVVGVGSMGRNHARVYGELPGVDLVGVTDRDAAAARTVADTYDTRALRTEELLDAADAVSVVVPTPAHYDAVMACIEADVDVLVEKPFVLDADRGRALDRYAREAGVTLQVGHVERFNPAVRVAGDIVPDLDVIAVDARRLGPPVDRDVDDSAVLDLMIHDLDVVFSLLDARPATVDATGALDNQYATANCRFDDGTVATFTASRVTQRKVRRLTITARECVVEVDYTNQSVEIHRHTAPEYVESDGDVRHRTESVVERPMVRTEEPLKRELDAFRTAVVEGGDPEVTAADGVRALEAASLVDHLAARGSAPEVAQ